MLSKWRLLEIIDSLLSSLRVALGSMWESAWGQAWGPESVARDRLGDGSLYGLGLPRGLADDHRWLGDIAQGRRSRDRPWDRSLSQVLLFIQN